MWPKMHFTSNLELRIRRSLTQCIRPPGSRMILRDCGVSASDTEITSCTVRVACRCCDKESSQRQPTARAPSPPRLTSNQRSTRRGRRLTRSLAAASSCPTIDRSATARATGAAVFSILTRVRLIDRIGHQLSSYRRVSNYENSSNSPTWVLHTSRPPAWLCAAACQCGRYCGDGGAT